MERSAANILGRPSITQAGAVLRPKTLPISLRRQLAKAAQEDRGALQQAIAGKIAGVGQACLSRIENPADNRSLSAESLARWPSPPRATLAVIAAHHGLHVVAVPRVEHGCHVTRNASVTKELTDVITYSAQALVTGSLSGQSIAQLQREIREARAALAEFEAALDMELAQLESERGARG